VSLEDVQRLAGRADFGRGKIAWGLHNPSRRNTSHEENRERLEAIRPTSPFRRILARFRPAADGGHSELVTTMSRSVIAGKTSLIDGLKERRALRMKIPRPTPGT
jgi:hypothetical protein